MTMQRFFYHFVICLYVSFTSSFLFSMQAPETSIFDALIPLTIESYHHIVPLKDVLKHITTYQRVSFEKDDKISGFHYYGHTNPKIEEVLNGTLIKVNKHLWIFTYNDISTFHTGYIIYQGKVYAQPKSFFPSTWSLKAVATYIQELAEQSVYESMPLPQAEHTYSITMKALYDLARVPLKLVLHKSLRTHILTIHPIVKETKKVLLGSLETIAVQQRAENLTVRENKQETPTELFKILSQQDCSLYSVIDLLEESAIEVKNEKGQTALMLAAQAGRCDLINVFLERGILLEEQDNVGNTALHYAIDSEVYEAVLGLAHQAVINKANKKGETPLMRALQRKLYDIAELLLYLGADVNTSDNYGCTPLIYAIKHHTLAKEELEACKAFIEATLKKGSLLNAQDSDGYTALMHALAHHNVSLAKCLLDHQADYCTIRNQREETAYMLATQLNIQEIVSLLHEKEKEKKALAEHKEQQKKQEVFLQTLKEEILKGTISRSSLQALNSLEEKILNKIFLFAVKESKATVVEQLLKAPLQRAPEVYHEALTLAFTRNIGIFSTLIQHHSLKRELIEEWFLKLLEVQYKEQRGNYTNLLAFIGINYPYALTKALQNAGSLGYFLSFIEKRVINFSQTQAGELFLEAIRYNVLPVIEQLLTFYPSVLPYKNGKGQNALMIAALSDHASLITYLYKKGLQLHEQDNSGKTAINYAPADSNALKELQSHITQEEYAKQEKQRTTLLQEQKSEVERLQRLGYSPLMIAAYCNDVETLQKDKITNINSTICCPRRRGGADQVHRPLRRLRDGRALPLQRQSRPLRLRRPHQTRRGVPPDVPAAAAPAGSRGLSGRRLLPALAPAGARGQAQRRPRRRLADGAADHRDPGLRRLPVHPDDVISVTDVRSSSSPSLLLRRGTAINVGISVRGWSATRRPRR